MKDPNKRNEFNSISDMQSTIKGATYVIQSTLNQAVNYIPAKIFDFKNIINITINESLHFNNKIWDKNLFDLLNNDVKLIEIDVNQASINNIEDIKQRIVLKLQGKTKVFWNITGGQRPLVLAIYQIITEMQNIEHYVCYLDGNSGKMIVSDKHFRKIGNFDYSLSKEQFDIPKALQLMGFDNNDKNEKKESDVIPRGVIQKIAEKYLEDEVFRKELISSKGDKASFEKALSSFKDSFNISDYHSGSLQKFGYLLEDMSAYQMYSDTNLYNNILDIRTSLKLTSENTGDQTIDEFDILVLNKYGHLINFECKSGGMTGDVAKSTNYSTYAISGVYGKPILITPLLKKDIVQCFYYGDKHLKSAIESAKHANLECWGIDEIAERLRKYLK